jgi:hypothetical protein
MIYKDIYQDHPSMLCTSKVFMGDSDKEGSEQMVKLAIQQFGC